MHRPLDSNDLVVTLDSGETLTIAKQFDPGAFGYESIFSQNNNIELFYFQDGSGYTYQDIQDLLLESTAGNDTLVGYFRQDTLDGGAGDDLLMGGTEGDTYIFKTGYGHDTILDVHQFIAQTDNDVVRFEGLDLADAVSFSRIAATDDLVIDFGNGDQLTVQGQFTVYNVGQPPYRIEQFQFDDVTLNAADIWQHTLNATAGNDTLAGSYADDTLNGLGGDDLLLGCRRE